ncbi:hypothetical protein ABVE18_09600 [Xanthomonas euvesicatoria]
MPAYSTAQLLLFWRSLANPSWAGTPFYLVFERRK